MKRILITGSREWIGQGVIDRTLDRAWAYLGGDPETVLVSGACPRGADAMCERWASLRGIAIERHPADWNGPAGRGAGFARNAEMVNAGADLCVAFIVNRSRGATHTANLAEEAGIETWRLEG